MPEVGTELGIPSVAQDCQGLCSSVVPPYPTHIGLSHARGPTPGQWLPLRSHPEQAWLCRLHGVGDDVDLVGLYLSPRTPRHILLVHGVRKRC